MKNTSELVRKVEQILTDNCFPLWFPDLTKDLTQIGWTKLNQQFQITAENYGTNRVLSRNKNASRQIITKISKDEYSTDVNEIILLEMLPPETTHIYSKQDIEFYQSSEILGSPLMETLLEAFSILQLVPSIHTTVFDLVRSLQLIKSDEAGEYDISFSEPNLPFSIFVSIPPKKIFADFLRVAEAIIHEAMHLQLTLIESVIPLINNNKREFYSPWKGEYRTLGGVLHALYVFRVLDTLFRELIDNVLVPSQLKAYLLERRDLIARQVTEVRDFASCPDLSLFGKVFVQKLLCY